MDLEKDREIKPEEDQVLPELLELLGIFRDLPEARKKNMKTRLKKEAAGEILTEAEVEKERKKIMELFKDVEDDRKKKMTQGKRNGFSGRGDPGSEILNHDGRVKDRSRQRLTKIHERESGSCNLRQIFTGV